MLTGYFYKNACELGHSCNQPIIWHQDNAKICDQSEFYYSMVVGAKWAGWSIPEIIYLSEYFSVFGEWWIKK